MEWVSSFDKVLKEADAQEFQERLPDYLMQHFGPKAGLKHCSIHKPKNFEEAGWPYNTSSLKKSLFKLQQEIAKRQ